MDNFRFKKTDYTSLEEVIRELGEERVVRLINQIRRTSVKSCERNREARALLREKYQERW